MYRGQIGLKVKIPQSGSVLEHIVYSLAINRLNLGPTVYHPHGWWAQSVLFSTVD